MKKINLKNLSIDEVLTKDELKKIVGGNGSEPGEGCQEWRCYCPWPGMWFVTTCSVMEVETMMDDISNMCGGTCNL